MTDRPILFSGPMIRALLEGRKTQTRRVLTPASMPDGWPGTMWPSYVNGQRVGDLSGKPGMIELPAADGGTIWSGPTPYVPGDRLWVREAWSGVYAFRDVPPAHRVSVATPDGPILHDEIWYWADGNPDFGDWERPRPSMFMPRWASRLTLIVTDVRVQRLQEISYSDAVSEGLLRGDPLPEVPDSYGTIWSSGVGDVSHPISWTRDPTEAFRHLWDSLNAKRGFGWDVNPWVVALAFNVIKQNIDQIEKEAA